MAGLPFLSKIPKIEIPAKLKTALKILLIPVIILIILLIYAGTKPYKVMLVKCEKEKIDWESKANGGHVYTKPVFTNAVFSMYLVDEQFVNGKRSIFSNKNSKENETQLKSIGSRRIPYSKTIHLSEYTIQEYPYMFGKGNNSWVILLSSGDSVWNIVNLSYNPLTENTELSIAPKALNIATFDNRRQYATGFYPPSYLTINDGNYFDLNTYKYNVIYTDNDDDRWWISNFCFIGNDKIVKMLQDEKGIMYGLKDKKPFKSIKTGDTTESRFRQYTPLVLSPNQDKVAWIDTYDKMQWLLTWNLKSNQPEKIVIVPDRNGYRGEHGGYIGYDCDTLKWNPNPHSGIIAMLAPSEVLIIDTKKKETINRFDNNASSVMHWSPDGSKLGFMSENQLGIYDMKTKTVKTLNIGPNGYNFTWVR